MPSNSGNLAESGYRRHQVAQPVYQTGPQRRSAMQITSATGHFNSAGIVVRAGGILGAMGNITENDQSIHPDATLNTV
jgi:hypothetical protein